MTPDYGQATLKLTLLHFVRKVFCFYKHVDTLSHLVKYVSCLIYNLTLFVCCYLKADDKAIFALQENKEWGDQRADDTVSH